jgi:hypothetical protein
MTDFLKKYTLPWFTKKILRNNKSVRKSTPYSAAKKVLILFTANGNQKFALVKNLQNKLEKDGIEVSFLYLLQRTDDRPDIHMDEGMVRMQKDNFTALGKLNDPQIKTLAEAEYDYLIHADLESNIYLDLLLAKSKARCRIGRYFTDDNPFYDLMIGISEDKKLNFFLEEVYRYTKSF